MKVALVVIGAIAIAASAPFSASALAAPPTGNFSLCALYVNETSSGFFYGLLRPSGSVESLMALPGLMAVFDGTAAGAEEGTFYTYCGYGQPPQKSTGILEAKFTAPQSTVYRTVVMPKSYAGDFYTPDLSSAWTSDTLGLVGTVQGIEGPDDTPTWTALSSIDPSTGVASVLRNITAEHQTFKWEKTGCSCFDSATETFYLIAGIGADEAETVLGYDAAGSAPIVIPFTTAYDAIALQWSVHFNALVALAYERNAPQALFSWLLQDKSAPGGWKVLYSWPAGSVFLGGMGETDIEDAGRIVAAALVVPDGRQSERNIVSFVDLVGGAEIQRILVEKKMVVADLEFCSIA